MAPRLDVPGFCEVKDFHELSMKRQGFDAFLGVAPHSGGISPVWGLQALV